MTTDNILSGGTYILNVKNALKYCTVRVHNIFCYLK